jgi:hypothetical protein
MDQLWYNFDMSDPREVIKCIKALERVCRLSLEYDEWQRHCKYKDAKICPVCNDDYYDKNSKCESHHHPKTLFSIVEDILNNHLELNDLDDQTGISIVQEIMDKHLLKQVSYINLCVHCHKKYHAGHPDVINAIDTIFRDRVQEEKNKDVQEEDEELVVQTFGMPVAPEDDIEYNNIKISVVEKTDIAEILEIVVPPVEVKPIELYYNETNNSFIEININDS